MLESAENMIGINMAEREDDKNVVKVVMPISRWNPQLTKQQIQCHDGDKENNGIKTTNNVTEINEKGLQKSNFTQTSVTKKRRRELNRIFIDEK